jgi:hypothetical protein
MAVYEYRVREVRRAIRGPATYVRARSVEGTRTDLPQVWHDRYASARVGVQLQDIGRLISDRCDAGGDTAADERRASCRR